MGGGFNLTKGFCIYFNLVWSGCWDFIFLPPHLFLRRPRRGDGDAAVSCPVFLLLVFRERRLVKKTQLVRPASRHQRAFPTKTFLLQSEGETWRPRDPGMLKTMVTVREISTDANSDAMLQFRVKLFLGGRFRIHIYLSQIYSTLSYAF